MSNATLACNRNYSDKLTAVLPSPNGTGILAMNPEDGTRLSVLSFSAFNESFSSLSSFFSGYKAKTKPLLKKIHSQDFWL